MNPVGDPQECGLPHHHPNRAALFARLPDSLAGLPSRDGLGALILAVNEEKALRADAGKPD